MDDDILRKYASIRNAYNPGKDGNKHSVSHLVLLFVFSDLESHVLLNHYENDQVLNWSMHFPGFVVRTRKHSYADLTLPSTWGRIYK